MFAAYCQDAKLPVNDASAPTAKDDFISAPDKLCTEITVKDEQNQIAFHYRVQDSPGGASPNSHSRCSLSAGPACSQAAVLSGSHPPLLSASSCLHALPPEAWQCSLKRLIAHHFSKIPFPQADTDAPHGMRAYLQLASAAECTGGSFFNLLTW